MNFQPPYWYFNQNVQTFNTLNTLRAARATRRRAWNCASTALMARALDEPDAVYGLVARTVAISDDRNSFTFRLRPEARFHDGSPLTAEDVAFSLMLLKKDGHPNLAQVIRELSSAEARDPATVVVRFSTASSRRAPSSTSPASRSSRRPTSTRPTSTDRTLDAAARLGRPTGSAASRPGSYIEYERVADYWGKDLPVNRGINNFDAIRYRVLPRAPGRPSRPSRRARSTVPRGVHLAHLGDGLRLPRAPGRQGREARLPGEKRPSMQGWSINQRRERFQDDRGCARRSASCFDFEWTNRNLFFDSSYAALAVVLRELRLRGARPAVGRRNWRCSNRSAPALPAEVFGEAWRCRPSDGSGRDRKLLGKARRAAGARPAGQRDGTLRNAQGRAADARDPRRRRVFVRVDALDREPEARSASTPRSARSTRRRGRRARPASTST